MSYAINLFALTKHLKNWALIYFPDVHGDISTTFNSSLCISSSLVYEEIEYGRPSTWKTFS